MSRDGACLGAEVYLMATGRRCGSSQSLQCAWHKQYAEVVDVCAPRCGTAASRKPPMSAVALGQPNAASFAPNVGCQPGRMSDAWHGCCVLVQIRAWGRS